MNGKRKLPSSASVFPKYAEPQLSWPWGPYQAPPSARSVGTHLLEGKRPRPKIAPVSSSHLALPGDSLLPGGWRRGRQQNDFVHSEPPNPSVSKRRSRGSVLRGPKLLLWGPEGLCGSRGARLPITSTPSLGAKALLDFQTGRVEPAKHCPSVWDKLEAGNWGVGRNRSGVGVRVGVPSCVLKRTNSLFFCYNFFVF